MKRMLSLLIGVLLLSCSLVDDGGGQNGGGQNGGGLDNDDNQPPAPTQSLQVSERKLDWLKESPYEVKASDDLSLFGFAESGKIKIYSPDGTPVEDISPPPSLEKDSWDLNVVLLEKDLVIVGKNYPKDKKGTYVRYQNRWTKVSSSYFGGATQGYDEVWLQNYNTDSRAFLDLQTTPISFISKTQNDYQKKIAQNIGAEIISNGGFRKGSYTFTFDGSRVSSARLSSDKIRQVLGFNKEYFLVRKSSKSPWGGALLDEPSSYWRFRFDGSKPLRLPFPEDKILSFSFSADYRTGAASDYRENIYIWREGYALKKITLSQLNEDPPSIKLSSDGNTLWVAYYKDGGDFVHMLYRVED